MAGIKTTEKLKKQHRKTVNGYLLDSNGAILKGQGKIYRNCESVGRYRPTIHNLHII